MQGFVPHKTTENKERQPLVSIVIPCFNAAEGVGEAIESCLNQSHHPLEIMIVDDGSTDDTLAIIEDYAVRHPEKIRWMSQENRGPAVARNRGLMLAKGEYIQWLDADDILESDKIRPQVEFLENHPEVDGVYGDWKEGGTRRSFPLEDFLLEYVGGKWQPVHAFLIRRSIAERYSWDESLRALEDQDYWIQQALQGARFMHVLTRDCAIYRVHPSTVRRNRMDERWLKARLTLHEKTEDSFRKAGLLEDFCYRLGISKAYVGLAWRSFSNGYSTLGDTALKEAGRHVSLQALTEINWPFPVFRNLGLRNSLLWHGRAERLKVRIRETLSTLASNRHHG